MGSVPSSSRSVMALSPAIHNRLSDARVGSSITMGCRPGGEMPQQCSSPGPLRQTSKWEGGVHQSSGLRRGLPFPTASNTGVVPSPSKPLQPVRRPLRAVPGLWLALLEPPLRALIPNNPVPSRCRIPLPLPLSPSSQAGAEPLP